MAWRNGVMAYVLLLLLLLLLWRRNGHGGMCNGAHACRRARRVWRIINGVLFMA